MIKMFPCPICKKVFSNVWDAIGHLNREHTDEELKEWKLKEA